jgi:enoyl-CoA hydratase
MAGEPSYQFIRTRTDGAVGIVQLYRPEALNALSTALIDELIAALQAFDADESIHCLIITGNDRAFAAGADIKDMADAGTVDMVLRDNLARWERIRAIKKPIIAAVSGFVLGGGNELAMTCDMVIASDTAVFGQPEINIGVMPGAGGTQRLTRAIGKARAMEMILTGRTMTAHEAYAAGLVTHVVPREVYLDEALRLAREIATKSPLAVRLAKQAVLKAHELPLREGLEAERTAFYTLFSSEDQKEGMRAFIEKRKPTFQGR